MMNVLFFFVLFLAIPAKAEGPLYRHPDHIDQVEFDNVYQDIRSAKTQIPKNVEWTSYTPTFNGLGTPTSVTAYYKVTGNTLYIFGQFVMGTTTASEARIGLPTGYTSNSGIPTSPTNQIIGNANYVASSTTQYFITAKPSVTYVNIVAADATHNTGTLLNGNALFSSGNNFVFSASIPL